MKAKTYWVLAFLIAGTAISGRTALGSSPKFSKASLIGTYAGSGHGLEWFNTGGSPSQDKKDLAYAGVRAFDGSGHFSGSYTITFGDTYPPADPQENCVFTETGTYTVNADGTGTATALQTPVGSSSCPQATITGNFAISDGGATFCLVSTTITPTSGPNPVVSLITSGCAFRQ